MGFSGKAKAWKAGDPAQPKFSSSYKVEERWSGNCMDVVKNSNKYYNIERHSANGKARIYTIYGRVGKTGTEEYRYYDSEHAAKAEYETLIRKKRDRKKNPYTEVDLAITAIGSEGGKAIKKTMTGINVDEDKTVKSSLHPKVVSLVSGWFGATGTFIEMNLKCPLGQLTKEQIDKGRGILDECLKRTKAKTKTGTAEYDTLTSQFYSLIPHVLPHRINPDALRLNDVNRIMERHDVLDTFMSAKNVQSVMGKGTSIDKKYATLNADIDYVEPNSDEWKWLNTMVLETRANNHHYLGNLRVHNIYRLNRHKEFDLFAKRAEAIAGERSSKGFTWPDVLRGVGTKRPDLNKEERDLYRSANILPLWHGTRTQNLLGITKSGLLIRPSGAVYTGSAFGDGIYKSSMSTKSLNYSSASGTYWAKGGSKTGFMFLSDTCLGDPEYVSRSGFYSAKSIAPKHSVWAKAGRGGFLVNDEMIVYHPSGPKQQHYLRYILEIETKAR